MTLGTCLSALIACGEPSSPGWTTDPSAWESFGASTEAADAETEAGTETPLSTSGTLQACGDGVIDPGEGCDDGNLDAEDGCDAACMPIAAVDWTYTHNGGAGKDDVASGVAVDSDGRVFVVGAEVVQSRDALILALAPDGSELWRKTIDTAGFDDAFLDVAIDGEGRIYAAGYEASAADAKAATVRAFTADGSNVWSFSEPALAAGSAEIAGLALADGALYSTGTEGGAGSQLVIRRHVTASGEATWKTSTLAAASSTFAGGIAISGPEMIAAGSAEVESELHPLLVRIDHAGTITSTAIELEVRGAWSDVAAIGSEGDVVTSGRLAATRGENFEVAARRITAAGAVQWTRTVDHRQGFDSGRGVAVGANQAVFVAGVVTTIDGDLEIFGGRFTGAGEPRWTHVHKNRGAGLDDHGAAAAFGSGFIVLAGDEQVPGEGANVWVRRFSAE